ncbi:MAG: hypothetical protein JWL95_512, partial [Gemmatimonadetes bacterium]|nr:hypothetical protein [Gemmatimonadota bacterium]
HPSRQGAVRHPAQYPVMRSHTRTRRGFSLVEIITALTILSIIGLSLTRLMLSQTRAFQYDSGGRRARTAARSAMNILITDLRMTQDNGGVAYLDATNNRRVDVKVPVAFGLVCVVGVSEVIMSMVPVDSFQLASMRLGGYAIRNATNGIYAYVSGGTMAAADTLSCHGGGAGRPAYYADTVRMGGRRGGVYRISGAPPAGTVPGSMAFVWQTVRYSFDPSAAYPGRLGLYRIITYGSSADTNELIAPFSSTARFSYYTNPPQTNDAATSTAPTDYNTLRGFKIFLPAEASDTVPGRTGPQKTTMTTAVFFKNTRNQ